MCRRTMTDKEIECPNCGPLTEEETRDTLSGLLCEKCKTKIGTSSDELVDEVKENHDYL